jgi:hypothetical protein
LFQGMKVIKETTNAERLRKYCRSFLIVSRKLAWKNKRHIERARNPFVLVVLCLALGVTTRVTQAQIVPITIVSVGDSYASGEGAPDLPGAGVPLPRWRGDNRDMSAVKCHRSNNAAPALAAKLIASIRPASFFHFACSGAVITPDLTGPGGQLATAARIVGGPIDVLIISIGGNDVGFAAVVGSCLVLPCELFGPAAFPTPVFALSPKLRTLVAAVAAMPVPVRHVFLTEYPDPSTTPYPGPAHRCGSLFPPTTPNIPASGFDKLDSTEADIAAATVIIPLNVTLMATVGSAPAITPGGPTWHFVTGISAAFDTHGYCMGWPNPPPHMWITGRMVNTFTDSELIQGDERGTMHPNASGQSAAATAISTAILASVPIATTPGTPTLPGMPTSPGTPTPLGTSAPPIPPCKLQVTIGCPGYCNHHPTDLRCLRNSDECLNRHLPGCRE